MNITKKIKAQGGGCFPAGTKINTPRGYRFIEDLIVGDEVFAFTLESMEPGYPQVQPGRVFIKKITETFKHSFGEVGYTSRLLQINYAGDAVYGTMTVTGNHYILTPSRQSEETDEGFARADQLQVGDTIWGQYGEELTITAIQDGDEYDFVYNFEVEDLHTYIADGIRVHNGGGGKKKAPKQAPDTIDAHQFVRLLLCPTEGESGGPANSEHIANSILFDGTPLADENGAPNAAFGSIAIDYRPGLPDQTVIQGFSAVEAENLLDQPLTSALPITRTMSADIDAVRITVAFPQGLQQIDSKSGDANGTSVSFRVQRRVQGGTWETVVSPTVKEMSQGSFEKEMLLARPAMPGVWEWRVYRTTGDSTSNYLINATNLDSYTEIQNVQIAYENRALVAIAVPSEATNGRVPNIALDWLGVKMQVPSNYNVATRSYSGAWDGTFQQTRYVCDNPAWFIYELLTNERYGMAAYGLDSNEIDIYSFYEAAKYCDELVNDGKGTGTFEPRFTFNAQLMVQENGWKVLTAIAAVMNAQILVGQNGICISQDRPMTPERVINNSNVIDGLFTYNSSPAESTYTQVNVTYNDPDDQFLPKTVTEVASVDVQRRFKNNKTEIAAYGATTEGQARRAAKWVLDTSLNQSRLVEFVVGLDNAGFEPGEVFLLMDADYAQVTQEGRVTFVDGNVIGLDKAINKTATGNWKIAFYSPEGDTITERAITSAPGITSTVTISGTNVVTPGSPYIITGAISPRQFKLVSMMDNGNLTYTCNAVQHDPNKYARVEQGIILPDEVYWQPPDMNIINSVRSLTITPGAAINSDGQIYRSLTATWLAPTDGTAISYTVQWSRNGQPLQLIETQNTFVTVPADFSGTYDFYVNAVNLAGTSSPIASASYAYSFEGGGDAEMDAVTGLRLADGASSFNGTMSVLWNQPETGIVKDYVVVLSTAAGVEFKRFNTAETGFVYSYDANVADGGPRPAIQVTVYPRDLMNNLGPGTAALFSSSSPAAVTNLQVRGGGTEFNTLDLEVTWEATTGSLNYAQDPNFGYFNVEVKKGNVSSRSRVVNNAAFTYTFNDNVKDNGQDTPSNAITIIVTLVNKLGVASASASATFTPAAPAPVTNLFVKGRTDTVFNENDLNFVWSAIDENGKAFSASNTFKHFKLEFYNGATKKREDKVFSEAYSYTLDMNTQDNVAPIFNPKVRVYAVNVYNISSAVAEATFVNPAPALPANIQITPGIGNYKVSFSRHQEWDVAGTFVWQSTTANFTPSAANLVATMAGDANYLSLNVEPGTKYYVKVAPFDVFRVNATDGAGLNVSTEVSVSGETAGIPSYTTAPDPSTAEVGDAYIDKSNPAEPKLYTFDGTNWVLVTAKVAADSITAREIAADAVGTNELKSNSITSDKVVVNSLTGDRIKAGTLDINTATAVQLFSNNIDTRGLTIKDANGTVIFGAGTAVPANLLGNVTPSLIGAIGTNNKLTAQNISAYVNTTAIDQAYIGTISAFKIDTRGLDIKDNDGNVIFRSGVPLVKQAAANPNLCPPPLGMTRYGGAGTNRNGDGRFGDGQYAYLPVTGDSNYCGVESQALGIPWGAAYTVSFEAYCEGAPRTLNVDVVNSIDMDSNGISVTVPSHNLTRFSFTEYAVPSDNARFARLRMFTAAPGGSPIVIANIKVELGTTVTPWTNDVITPQSASTFIQNAAIQDAQIANLNVSKVQAQNLSALSANIGVLRTRDYGGRVEIVDNQIRVYDDNGALRVLMGAL